MRKGGGKSKGGAYETATARRISKAFAMFGILEDDCYRTKNSGATKAQPGDLQLSPVFAKLLPAVIECKHYRTILFKLGRKLSAQPKSYPIHQWWLQVRAEEKASTRNHFGLLIMRENNCDDLCAFSPVKLHATFNKHNLRTIPLTRNCFDSLLITHYKEDEIWIVPLSEFLEVYTLYLKWYTLFDTFKF